MVSDKTISSQLQMITLGADGSAGDRRLLFSLQQCARNFFHPVARIASQSPQVFIY